MITQQQNKIIAGQIGDLYCRESSQTNKDLCAQVIKNRLISNLTDAIFVNDFLPYLTTSNFLAMKVISISPTPGSYGQKLDVTLDFIDIVSGYNSQITIRSVPVSLLSQEKWLDMFRLLNSAPMYYYFLGVVNDSFQVRVLTPNHYNIVYNPEPIPPGGGSGGGSGSGGGGGSIQIEPGGSPPVGSPPSSPPVQQASFFGGMDLNSLLIPGAIALGLYLFMRK